MQKYTTSVLIGVLAFLPLVAGGQNAIDEYKKKKTQQYSNYVNGKQKKFDEYKLRKRKEFEEYRRRKNAEFAKYLGRDWQEMSAEKAIPVPTMPEPDRPITVPKDETDPLPENPIEVPKGEVIPIPVPKIEPPKEIPLPLPSLDPLHEKMTIPFFGLNLPISMNMKLKFRLNGLKEKDIERVWNLLSEDDYTSLLDDCVAFIQDLQLNGWGVFKLCELIGNTLQEKGTNEAVLLQTYLLTQLGYDARMVRVNDNSLVMICPCSEKLCQVSYIDINGKDYYVFGELPNGSTMYSYKDNFDASIRAIDFSGATSIRLGNMQSSPRTFTSSWNQNASVTVKVNENLMNFYASMPYIKDWSFYARQQMDSELFQMIMPVMRNTIAGKGKLEAANILLHFVQTAFKYQTDQDQFQREKTDFKEELFYDEACDCEDRSVLFSEFVHTLLNLDVVLLHYPNHMCTAVKFIEDVRGDYVTVDGVKFIICDPTYINASVGTCMPKFKYESPTIYKVYGK